MKKVIALLLALVMVLSFAACKKADETKPTDDKGNTVAAGEAIEENVVPEDDKAEPSSEDVTDDKGEVATNSEDEKATTPDGKPDNNKKPDNGKKPVAQSGLNSTNAAEVAAFYVKARNASLAKPPKGKQVMKLDGKLSADGGLVGTVLPIAQPIINSALSKNSVETNFIPAGGYSPLKGSDITSCSAKVSGNYTIVNVKLHDQTDGSNGNKTNGGSVARGIGTLGSIDEALHELNGIELSKGRENVKLTYTNAYFQAKVDNSTGKIVGGTWHYLVKINISSAELNVKGMKLKLNNLRGAVDYTVTI